MRSWASSCLEGPSHHDDRGTSARWGVPPSRDAICSRTIVTMTTTVAATSPTATVLDDLVRRIRTVIEPKRIVLFGSAARGTMGPDSDLDVLVVADDGVHRIHTSQAIYGSLRGFGHATDIVVVTDADIRRDFGKSWSVITDALREGRQLYTGGVVPTD